MLRAIVLSVLASLSIHVGALGLLKVIIERVTRGAPNPSAIVVSIVGFFWFGAHAIGVTRVGERVLGGHRRASAIAITVTLTLLELGAVLVWTLWRTYATWRG
jgi:hypothetical protein